jgi:single-stranded DNA-binding protein
MIVGRLQTQSWEKDGVKRQRTEIVASDINFLDRPGEGGGEGYTPSAPSDSAPKPAAKPKSDDVVIEDLDSDAPVNLDDIPF